MLRDLIVVRRVYLHVQSVHHSAELEKRVEPSSQYSDSEGSVEERTHSTFRSSLSKRLRTQLQQKSMLALSPQLPAQPTSEAVDTVAKQTSPKPGMFQPVSLPACAVNMAAASSTVQGIGSYPLTCMRDSCRHRTCSWCCCSAMPSCRSCNRARTATSAGYKEAVSQKEGSTNSVRCRSESDITQQKKCCTAYFC